MLHLIKIEWLKIKKYPAFWWMFGIVLLAYPGLNFMFYYSFKEATSGKEMINNVAKMLFGNPFAFPETWHSVAYFSSIFVMLPAILVIMLVTNEYNYKTHRQNIIDGWSRTQFITSKLCDVLIISLVATIVYLLTALFFGLYSDSSMAYKWADQLQYIPYFFIQTFAQLTIAFLLGYLVKKAFIALGIFLFYYMILENIAVLYAQFKLNDIGRFLPFEMSDRIIPPPAFFHKIKKIAGDGGYEHTLSLIPQYLLMSMALTAIIWAICFRVHKKRDL